MKSWKWTLAVVLALGMALHGSIGAADGPAEDRASAVTVAFAPGASQCQATAPIFLALDPGPDCTLSCFVDSQCTSHCEGPGVCTTGCPGTTGKKCVCVN